MQIVSEAFFQKIKEHPLLYASSHNRIAFITPSELVVRELTLDARCCHLKLKGSQVAALSLENSNFIVILFASGSLEVRRADSLTELLLTYTVTLYKDIPVRVRVSSECIYVLGKGSIEVIYLSKESGHKRIKLQDAKEQPEDMLISTIFEEEIILIQYPTSIAITAEGKNIAQAPFHRVNTFKLLKDPLLMEESKQFLLIVESRKCLKVFDIFDLEPILEMQLFLQQNEEVQIKIDPLYEYLMLRIFQPVTRLTKKNSLFKINGDFYKGSAKQAFFLFDIEVALKYDFVLFPTHIQTINGSQFYSIDMCFFAQREIRIATLVVDVNHRTKLHNTKLVNTSWISHSSWKDFFFNGKGSEWEEIQKQRQSELEYEGRREEDWEVFLERFYQQNMQKLKCQGFYKTNAKVEEEKKYLEFSGAKHPKDFIEYEDALNTLSGSSSFGSLKEMPAKLECKGPKFLEGDNFSSEQEEFRCRNEEMLQKTSLDSEQSQRDEYLRLIEGEVLDSFSNVQQKLQTVESKIDRLQHTHLRRLKHLKHSIKKHQNQTAHIDKSIEGWCKDQFDSFGAEVKGVLREYSSMIGRLQIIEIRNVKKLKKHYRDFLELQVEKCTEKLEQSQRNEAEIEKIVRKQERY